MKKSRDDALASEGLSFGITNPGVKKLGEEELLEELRQIKICVQAWEILNPKKVSWSGKREQAYRQIKEMIQKPEVTEEWIEEKAREVHDKFLAVPDDCDYKCTAMGIIKDFIRSLVEEIRK